MARNIIPGMFCLLTMQIVLIITFVTQLYGVFFVWRVYQKQRNGLLMAHVLSKRNFYLQKLKKTKERRLRRSKRRCWVKPGRTDKWWVNMLNGTAPEEFWYKNFRMSRDSFMELERKLRPYISPNRSSPNYRSLSSSKKLAITLYYLKDTGSLVMTGNTFGVAVCTVSTVVTEVTNAISNVLGPEYLHPPRNHDEMRQKVSEFESKFGLIQAFGCIDGTHVPLLRPVKDPQDYFCYKGYYSLNVQAVCDYRGIFMDIECMWPGSVHDAKVFANSTINKKMVSGALPGTFQSITPGTEKIPNYLIGDPAYPLTPFCMKEFSNCTKNEEVVFNCLLRSARNQVESAFGRLKARWSFLTKKVDLKLESVPVAIYACFVLHNFCEEKKSYVDQDLVKSQMELSKRNEEQYKTQVDPIFSCNAGEGEVVRRILTDYIKDNLPDNLVA